VKHLALFGAGGSTLAHTADIPWVNGSRVASATAETAILQYGTYDAYDVVVPSDTPPVLATYKDGLASAGVDLRRVRLIPLPLLRRSLATEHYTAIHDGNTPFIARLDAMVRASAHHLTPCTCVHFSISYGSMISALVASCVARIPPYCSIFCTSRDSCHSHKQLLQHLSEMSGLPGAPGHRLDLVPLGINVTEYQPQMSKVAARHMLQLPPDAKYIIYVGRLTPIDKADLDVLLRAFATVRRRTARADLRLILAGQDSMQYAEHLRARANIIGVADALHIFRNVSPLTKTLCLWASDVFVSPVDSVQESFGVSVR
jgi:D-inositol-3-phosphate glycosyltransferase